MRRVLVASLFLSTALLNAQTVTKGQSATLEARNDAANGSAAAAPAAADVTSTVQARRVSTGVIEPKLISQPAVLVSLEDFPTPDLSTEHAAVAFTVDQNGVPQNVHLVKSAGQLVDERILEAVRQSRFAPATLDNRAVAMDVNLLVNFTDLQ